MSTSSTVPKEISFSKPRNNGARIAFGDVTNRTKAPIANKTGKPTALKRDGTKSVYFGASKDVSKARSIPKKRDAALADLKPQDVDEASIATKTADDKRLALESLKDGAAEVSKAIDAEVFEAIGADVGSKPVLADKETSENTATTQPFIDAEAKSKPVLAVKKSSEKKSIINPFTKITQSQENYETLDLDKPAAAKVGYQYSADYHDIDERDQDDELCVTDYAEDMFEFFRDQEHRACVDPEYMLLQKEITTNMRAILIDWLELVCTKSKCSPEVFYLTVNIIDRYLDGKKATKKNLQLIGTAALFIASKYEDIYNVPVDDLVYLCDRAYTEEHIYQMEHKILVQLNYQISLPTTYKFLLRFLNAGHADTKMVHLSCYILELTTLSIKFTDHLPSELASAAVLIARKALGRHSWSPTLLHYTKYTEEEIIPVARAMVKAIDKVSPDLKSSKRRFASEKKMKVALIKLPQDL